MKHIFKKLRSSSGESITETLVAVLVITFAGLSLFYSVMTAARINRMVANANTEFRFELHEAEERSGDSAGTVTIHDPGSFSATLDVEYTGGSGKLTSYRLA